MKPTFFQKPAAFRAWLTQHHNKADELVVGFYKKDSGKPTITWPESVDEALCFGWIDGVRRSLGDEAYTIRFTPRRPTSTWSAINIARVTELTKLGRMQPAGLAAFARRTEKKSAIYAYEQKQGATLDKSYERTFRVNKKAWVFFEAQPPWYQRLVRYWVTSAKNEATRLGRLDKAIVASGKGKRV